MERWQNKVAVVTGACGGIGSACVKDLLRHGMIVVGLDLQQERLEKVLKAGLPKEQQARFHARKCDISKEEEIVKTFCWIEQNLDGVHVLLNTAAIVTAGPIVGENNSADLKAVIDTNVMGAAHCTREAFHSMKKRGIDGHIILFNSAVGHYVPTEVPMGGFNLYSPSKYAITAMTEVLRQELMSAGTKIKVTSLSPGAVNTNILKPLDLPAELPRLETEDISHAVIFCLQTPPHVQIHELTLKPHGEL